MKFSITRYNSEGVEELSDQIADEEPLQITVDGFPVAVVMRTPGDDLDLVHGFLLTEGFVESLSALTRVDLEQKKNHALVFLADGVEFDRAKLSRNLFSASSCGICGKASIESIQQQHPPVGDGFMILAETLLTFPDQLRQAQTAFRRTGGIHAAALFNASGELLVLREDVGRHNAIDKAVGWAAGKGIDCSEVVLQVSGRVSFEVMQKALAASIPIVSAISAPSSLAVEFARESNQGLIGFLRPPSFNVYSGAGRIQA
ncbi:formate dehydrogenase accessory sulfurtransferase FdhD [Roseibacillus persicicus]|uniref:formate dehydrogenase accessory sulfurtransferase FdhD n=1 Tax=Roseibacillus persicicus TaxID=454148 RepID=UPI00280EBB47|nr:formate dehydrogenase accessory sulfurtransferase FdhD [Roseibacillus persicicus]MDQ8191476.1 formate dehydrogenase accessory sulfurtransferase FdhD [Roseibacillus persicicus]